jgi:hypothetical protein
MVGGAKFQKDVFDWMKQSSHLYLSVFLSVIFLWTIYAEKVPAAWLYQLSTPIGRLLLLMLLYIVHMLAGWIPALLFAIAIALTWANRPLYKPAPSEKAMEGFDGGGNNTRVIDVEAGGHRWFVERALNETPRRIIQDRVSTDAVQDDSSKGNSRTSR